MKKEYDVVIVGSGVAGMTASLYLQRASINHVIIESGVIGGQLNKITSIDNYPGFSSIDGPTLASKMFEQINNGDNILYDEVINIDKKGELFCVVTRKGQINCHYVVLAMGRIPKKISCENAESFLGKGISYCALCDGSLYKKKDVVVLGSGLSAVEEAKYLSKFCHQVIIVNKRNSFNLNDILLDEINDINNIKIIYNNDIIRVDGNEHLQSVTLKDKQVINCGGLFVSIGYVPNNGFIDSIEMKNNYIVVDSNYETNVSNMYACGDIIKKEVYQIITACYEGTMVACQIIKKMKDNSNLN